MSDVTILPKDHGPLLVTGAVQLVDAAGGTFDLGGKQTIALCRCGASKNRPFCDGSHKAAGFDACDRVPTPT